MLLLAVKVTAVFDKRTRPECVKVLVLDDSVIKRNRSKEVELIIIGLKRHRNQLVKYLGGEWYHFVSKDHESCSVEKCKTMNGGTNCLSNIVGGYTQNGMNWVRKIFLELYQKSKK